MTNPMHEANRVGWDAVSAHWQADPDLAARRARALVDPRAALDERELRHLGDVRGQRAAVLGSGDQLVVLALAGMGARVTSVDLSSAQLEVGAANARALGAPEIAFLRADVTDLSALADGAFDLAYTGGHVAVWVSDLRRYYAEAARILRPGGRLVVNEYHPFRRVWADRADRLEVGYPYFERGPHTFDRADETTEHAAGSLPSYEFHWTVGDLVGALLAAGCELVALEEWGQAPQGEAPPLVGLPECLLLVGVKR